MNAAFLSLSPNKRLIKTLLSTRTGRYRLLTHKYYITHLRHTLCTENISQLGFLRISLGCFKGSFWNQQPSILLARSLYGMLFMHQRQNVVLYNQLCVPKHEYHAGSPKMSGRHSISALMMEKPKSIGISVTDRCQLMSGQHLAKAKSRLAFVLECISYSLNSNHKWKNGSGYLWLTRSQFF